jgi:hypothetical protein
VSRLGAVRVRWQRLGGMCGACDRAPPDGTASRGRCRAGLWRLRPGSGASRRARSDRRIGRPKGLQDQVLRPWQSLRRIDRSEPVPIALSGLSERTLTQDLLDRKAMPRGA